MNLSTNNGMTKALLGTAMLLAAAGLAHGQVTQRITTDSVGLQGAEASTAAYITPDGRWVVFNSLDDTLVPGDNNHIGSDVFVKDRLTGVTVRVSIPDPATGFSDANAGCFVTPGVRSMSDDGRYVVFASSSERLVVGDTQPLTDIFVHDRDADEDGIYDEAGLGNIRTSRVSLTSSDGQATDPCPNFTCSNHSNDPCISANGRYVAWASNFNFVAGAPEYQNIYRRDRDPDADGNMDESNAVTILCTPIISCGGCVADGGSYKPTMSSNGRYIAFTSDNSRLVFSDNNQDRDAFVRDCTGNRTMRISLDTDETEGFPHSDVMSVSISDSGRFVVFTSGAAFADGPGTGVPQDTNNAADVFLRELDPNLNAVLEETQDNPGTPGVVETEGTTRCLSIGRAFDFQLLQFVETRLNNSCTNAIISGNAEHVAFQTRADNVICGLLGCDDAGDDEDVYLVDVAGGQMQRVSVDSTGDEPNGHCLLAALSNDGGYVLMNSVATDLAGLDLNGTIQDGYLRAGAVAKGNDACGTVFQVQAGTVYGDTTGTAADGAAPCVSNASSPDLYYSYLAPCSGTVVIDTMGSGFDTVLSVHTACPATAGNAAACNDDISQTNRDSVVTLSTVAGQIYYIRVSGFSGQSGLFQLNVYSCQTGPSCDCDWDGSGALDSSDFFAFLNGFFNGNADFNGSGATDSSDFFDFLGCFFSGCP